MRDFAFAATKSECHAASCHELQSSSPCVVFWQLVFEQPSVAVDHRAWCWDNFNLTLCRNRRADGVSRTSGCRYVLELVDERLQQLGALRYGRKLIIRERCWRRQYLHTERRNWMRIDRQGWAVILTQAHKRRGRFAHWLQSRVACGPRHLEMGLDSRGRSGR